MRISGITESYDISVIRQIVAELTKRSPEPFKPGYHRKPFACSYCGMAFASDALRYHRPRCERNPKLFRKTWNERVLGAKRVTLRDMLAILEYNAMLNDGPQGAD